MAQTREEWQAHEDHIYPLRAAATQLALGYDSIDVAAVCLHLAVLHGIQDQRVRDLLLTFQQEWNAKMNEITSSTSSKLR